MALKYEQFFAPGKARDASLLTDAFDRFIAVVTSDVWAPVPRSVATRTSQGVVGMLNAAGATSIEGATPAETELLRRKLFDVVVRLFGGDPSLPFELDRISFGSGGTRVINGTLRDALLTGTMTAVEAPGLALMLAMARHPDDQSRWPLTWGHTPRTNDETGYGGEQSSYALGRSLDASAIPNPMLSLFWMLQAGATTPAKWNGDLKKYIELMTLFQGSLVGLSGNLILSGGKVTAEEVLLSLMNRIRVLGIVGTGRAADALVLLKEGRVDQIAEAGIHEFYAQILAERLDLDLITLVDTDHLEDGQDWLEQEMGFGRRLRRA